MSRIDGCTASARLAIAVGSSQLASSFALVDALVKPAGASPTDLDACLAFARSFVERGLPTYTGPVVAMAGWPTDEDIRREEARLAFEEDLAARIELCLCVFGTVAACSVRDHGTPAGSAEAVKVELARHRAHRETERDSRLAKLTSERDGWRGNQEMVAQVEARLRLIMALDPQQLCTDRCCLD